MKCPFCGNIDDKVIDSRAAGTGEVIRRRREPFDRQKLVRGLRTACNKRPVSIERIETVADSIEREVQEAEKREVSASELGERVMVHLRELDEVAYVRFASVYRSFRDVDEFLRELGKLVQARGG